jgi:hypothetical protein
MSTNIGNLKEFNSKKHKINLEMFIKQTWCYNFQNSSFM